MREVLMDPAIVKKTESLMMYGGAVLSFIAGLFGYIVGIGLSNWAVILGIVITLLGFFMKWREHRMKAIEHKLMIERTNAEIFEIKTRTIFMERAGLNNIDYHTPSKALEALKDPQNEPTS